MIEGIVGVILGLGVFLGMLFSIFYPIILVFRQKMLHLANKRKAAYIMLGFSSLALALPFFVAFYLLSIAENSAAGFGFAYTFILSPFISLLGLIIANKFKQ